MSHMWSRKALEQAAMEELGVCLECGEMQDFLESRLRLGLCHACGEQRVLPAEDAVRVLELVEEEEL